MLLKAHILREVVGRFADGSQSRADIDALVRHAHTLSTSYLRSRTTPAPQLGLSLDDLAFDVLGDLFERNDVGVFTRIQAIVVEANWSDVSDAALNGVIRRMVLGATSDAIFSSYRDADGSLSKIIRNLKRNLKNSDELELVEDAHVSWIYLSQPRVPENSSAHLPSWPEELFEARLHSCGLASDNIAVVLSHVFVALNSTTLYKKRVPLIMLCRIIRASSVRLNVVDADHTRRISGFSDGHIETIVKSSIQILGDGRRKFYIDNKKLSKEAYGAILNTVRDQILGHFCKNGNADKSNEQALRLYLPALSANTYKSQYRSIVEYLYRSVRDHVVDTVRIDFEISGLISNGNEDPIEESEGE